MNAARHAGLAMLGSLLEKGFFLITGIVVARYLGAEEYGIYTFATSFSFLFAIVSDGGLRTILTREVAKTPTRSSAYLGNVLMLKILMGAISVTLLTIAVRIAGFTPELTKAIYIAALGNLIWFATTPVISIIRAFGQMAHEGFLLAFLGATSMTLMLTAIHYGANTYQVLWALTGAYALMSVVAYLLVVRRFITPQFQIDLSLCRMMLTQAAPIGLAVFLAMAYSSAGTVALEALRDSRDVGLFSAATKLARNLNAFPMIFAGILLPTFTKRAGLGENHLSVSYVWALRLMMLLGFPLAAGGFALADQIVMLIYGAEFAASGAALRIVIWSLPFYYLSYVSKTLLEALSRQKLWTATLGIGLALNTLLNIALVPSMGARGAGLALMLTDLMILIGSYYFVAREVPHNAMGLAFSTVRALACAVLMGVVMYWARNAGLIIAVALGLAIYAVSIRVLKVLSQEEWTSLMYAAGFRVSGH